MKSGWKPGITMQQRRIKKKEGKGMDNVEVEMIIQSKAFYQAAEG